MPQIVTSTVVATPVGEVWALLRTVFAVCEVACVTQPRLFLRCYEPRI